MRTIKHKTLRVLATASVALTLAACGGKNGKGPKDPNKPATQQEKEALAKKKAEAAKEFAKAVEKYDKATEDGSLSGDECGRVANSFSKLYKEYGDMMMIAEFNAGAAWDECGQRDKAKAIYESLAKKKFFLALNNLGVIYWNEGNTSKALEYFQKSVDADKKKAFAARNNLAAAHRDRFADKVDQKDFDVAENHIQNVLAVDTSNKKAYENLARLYYDRGRLKDKSYLLLANLVVTQAIKVLKDEGEQSAALYNLAGLLRMQEDNQVEALKAFKKATEVEPKHIDANLNIAFISVGFRDYEQAEKSLDIALKSPKQKKNVEALLAMGVAKRGLKKYKESEKYYNDAAKSAGKDPRPYYNLGILVHEHMTADAENTKAQEDLFNVAKKHYGKFVQLAGAGKKWAKLVDDAKGRMLIIDQAIEAFRMQEELAKKAKELEELAKKQEAEEKQRLLDMEKAAMEAAEAEEAAASAPPADGEKKEEKKEEKKP